jgi:hypothetical protein
MGRQKQTESPVPIEFIRECFDIHDRQLIWKERPRDHFPCRPDDASRFNGLRAGGPAGMAGPDRKPMVRFQYQGATRRIALLRVAWIVATGELPHGVVRPRDGDEWNASEENLIVVKRGGNPFAVGKSSLKRRAEVDSTLLKTLAQHPGQTLPQLSRLTGSSASCCCTRLGKLSDLGLTCGPKCDARARWDLTPAGQALAATAQPVILDDRDRQVLAALALTGMGVMKLSRRIGVCPLTVKRRARLLAQRGLLIADPRRFFLISAAGLAALGDATPPRQPWVKVEAISAAVARDVVARNGHQPDDRSAAFRTRVAGMGAQGSMAGARLRKTGIGFASREFDRRMAG